MPKKRGHLFPTTSTEVRVKSVPSTQLNVRQVERELLLRERRRRLTSSQRNGAVHGRTNSKSTDAHFNHSNFKPHPHTEHYQRQEGISSNCRHITPGNTNSEIDSFHHNYNLLDETKTNIIQPVAVTGPPVSTNDENVNAKRPGRRRTRGLQHDRRDECCMPRIGRPRRVHRNVNCRVKRVPLWSMLNFSPKRTPPRNRRRSWSPASCSSSREDKSKTMSSSRGGSSERESSPSRYQVTPHPHEHRRSWSTRRHNETRRRSSGSENSSANSTPYRENVRQNNNPRAIISTTSSKGCRCVQCKGSKYQRSISYAGNSRRNRSYSREKAQSKRRDSTNAKERAKTIIERVTNAWNSPHSSKNRGKRNMRSRSGSRHRTKRHKSSGSRSRSISKTHRHRQKQKRDRGYLICRLM